VFATPVRADTAQEPLGAAAPSKTSAEAGGGGVVQLVDDALSSIQLRPEQSDALKKLGDQVDAKQAHVEQAKRDLLAALGAQIGTGKIDESALKPQVDALAKAADDACPAMRSAFETLHSTLTADQRTQFADNFLKALRQRLAEHRTKGGKWAEELNLNPTQKDEIHAILAKHAGRVDAALGRLVRLMVAFDSDKMSLDDIMPPGHAGKIERKMAEGLISLVAEVNDILTPDQRKIVASKLGHEPKAGAPSSGESTENTGTTRQPLWVGGGFRGVGYAGGIGYARGYGFSRGYMGGMGYVF
jgi:Spy/CpxP family protein refolding chaperone